MKIFYSESFKRDFQGLPKSIQRIAKKKLKLFVENSRHPLRVKRISGKVAVVEATVLLLPNEMIFAFFGELALMIF